MRSELREPLHALAFATAATIAYGLAALVYLVLLIGLVVAGVAAVIVLV